MAADHIVRSFDEDLTRLDNMIVEMGGLAEMQLSQAIEALVRRDVNLAESVAAGDARIDALEREVDIFTVDVLARRQPMAADLRLVISALKAANDLERIGDLSRNICKRTMALARTPPMGSAMNTVARMSRLVQEMIRNVLDAYIKRDVDMANDVWARDQEVDQLHTSLFRELLTYMMEDPRNITACTHLLFIAKNVERMGDHVTNIAEYIRMMVLGEMHDEMRPKDDQSSMTVISSDAVDARKSTESP
ncbi:MAG: phosphate signaling complex protein PhoU [Alphaproteobacteria bacterium]